MQFNNILLRGGIVNFIKNGNIIFCFCFFFKYIRIKKLNYAQIQTH